MGLLTLGVLCVWNASAWSKTLKHEKIVTLNFGPPETLMTVPAQSEYELDPLIKDLHTSILKGFKPPVGIAEDMKKAGYRLAQPNASQGNKQKALAFSTSDFPWGQVYTWQTPTRGSAAYSYICRKKDDFCFKVGPYTLIEFDWKRIDFKN
jgi:hypothetical protein